MSLLNLCLPGMFSSSSPPASVLSLLRQLPTTSGVYIFKDVSGGILYVGKAKNLKNRVSSYFRSPEKLGLKTAQLVRNIRSLEHIEVGSETESLLLEARLISKFRPPYNLASRDDKSPYYIHITREKYPKPVITHQSRKASAGPFLTRFIPTRILRQFRSVTPYCSSPRPVTKPCLYSHLGLCSPCPGQNLNPHQISLYRSNISRLRRLLSGQYSSVLRSLKKDMLLCAKKMDFEAASLLRDRISALNQLRSTPVSADEYLANPNLVQDQRQQALNSLRSAINHEFITDNPLHRIEMYDVSHLRGQSATAAMTVAYDGYVNSRLYRHFTIKKAPSDNDVGMLTEVLYRRLKRTDWPLPDLIILDGGKSQLSIINSPSLSLSHIPVIALAKGEETIIIPLSSGFKEIRLDRSHPGLRLLQHLRDEAHRFSRRLHHKHRLTSQILTSAKS